MAIDKDPWCCAPDKIRASTDGFDRGYITALKSARNIVRGLSTEEALQLLDELITEHTPFQERP